jgi:HK97 family phage major capsid protein
MEQALRRKLVVAPLFRQIAMKTNVMSIPVNPEVGSATWVTAFNPVGSSDPRTLNTTSGGSAVSHKLNEVTLNAYKIATKEFVGYEEEEDSLLVLMPMIREAMVRRCAKAIDSALLVGAADSTVPISGLANRAGASATAQQNAVATTVTLAKMRALRASLGNYGLDPADVAYIVSNEVYYDLMEADQFMTMEKVGPLATVITGQIGMIGGSPVIASGEMPAKPASGSAATTAGTSGLTNVAALAVNIPNFLLGSQRGLRMDTQELAAEQARVMVASMRVGMAQITPSVGVSALRWIG